MGISGEISQQPVEAKLFLCKHAGKDNPLGRVYHPRSLERVLALLWPLCLVWPCWNCLYVFFGFRPFRALQCCLDYDMDGQLGVKKRLLLGGGGRGKGGPWKHHPCQEDHRGTASRWRLRIGAAITTSAAITQCAGSVQFFSPR